MVFFLGREGVLGRGGALLLVTLPPSPGLKKLFVPRQNMYSIVCTLIFGVITYIHVIFASSFTQIALGIFFSPA